MYYFNNLESLKDIDKYWLNEVESYADPGTMLILVGNSKIIKVTKLIYKTKDKYLLKKPLSMQNKRECNSSKPLRRQPSR